MLVHELNPQTAWEPFRPGVDGPWDATAAAHLLRRAAFGGTPDQVMRAAQEGPAKTLDRLLDASLAADYENQMMPMARIITSANDGTALASWWLLKMAQSPAPAIEKLTLFWHGHFATSQAKVQDARAMLGQYRLLRAHALGSFTQMVQGISRDLAMMVYLDSRENRKTRPNENFARELMELFCLGLGNYTERDIKEIARCFTGWEVRRNQFRFNRYQHDAGIKTFFDQSGNFNGDQAIEFVLQQTAAPRFIARKLIRYYLSDDHVWSDAWIEPIAHTLRASQFQIEPAIRKILASRVFFAARERGARIKSPIELAISTLRFLNATTNMERLAQQLAPLGQLPFHPPSVKGWDGGRSWINAATILGRANLVQQIIESGDTRFANGDLAGWYRQAGWDGIRPLVNQWLAVPLEPDIESTVEDILGNDLPPPPERLAESLVAIAALPEFQLN